MTEALRLRALDADDLKVLSAHLQDAVVPIGEMKYLADDQRFVLVASRFRWESDNTPGPYERVNCGLVVDHVKAAKTLNLDQANRAQTLEILSLDADEGRITLVCGGGIEVRLEVSRIVCHLSDIGEPWPTQWRPSHPDEADE